MPAFINRQLVLKILAFTRQYGVHFCLCSIALAVLVLLVIAMTVQDYNQTVSSIEQTNTRFARGFDEHVQRSLIAIDDQIKMIKIEYEHDGMSSAIKAYTEQAKQNPLLLQMLILDETGKVISSLRPAAMGLNFSNRSYFITHAQSDSQRLFISEPIVWTMNDKTSVFLSRRLNRADGKFAGVVAMSVDSAYFTNFYQNMGFAAGHVIRIVATDGTILVSYNPGFNEVGENIRDGNLFAAREKSPSGNYYTPGRRFATPRFFSYRTMSDFPLVIQVGVNKDVALAEYTKRQDFYLTGAAFSSLMIIVITVGAIFYSRRKQQGEKELRESREKYKTLIDQAFEAVALVDPQTHQVHECNARFSEWFGYHLPEDAPLFTDQYVLDGSGKQDKYFAEIQEKGIIQVERRTFRHKNGSLIYMERAASLINVTGKQMSMITYRNISDQVQQEEDMRKDAAFAGQIQQALLSRPGKSDYVAVETIFRPSGEISGDMYHLEWRNDGLLLCGYLIAVPGTGVTTALYTSALNVLLHEAAELDATLPEQLNWMNKQLPRYFGPTVRISALAFEIDLQTREFRYAGAGISCFWAATAMQSGPVMVPGSELGSCDKMTQGYQSQPLAVGDLLYFSTDGLRSLMERHPNAPLERFREMVALLTSLPDDSSREGDTTAVCIRIKSLPQQGDAGKWPKIIKMNSFNDYRRLKGDVAKILTEVTGKAHSMQEVVLNEAIANALECRDGQSRSQKARVKINRCGNRLVARVSTTRIGFAGNAVLRRLRASPEDMFLYGENDTMGRGIPMMLSMSHKMMYNSEGTEVLLAWKLNS